MAKRVRRTALMRHAGPYVVKSHSNGLLSVYPQWADLYGKPSWMRETEEDHMEAGGPGLFSRLGIADDIQRFLNQPFPDEEVEWLKAEVERLADGYVLGPMTEEQRNAFEAAFKGDEEE